MLDSLTLGQAGLVFLKDRDFDIVAAANHTASGFEAMGQRITGVHVLSDDRAQVSTQSFDLMLDLIADVQPAALSETADLILNVTLYANGSSALSQFAVDALLTRLLQGVNAALQPDFVLL